MRFTIFDKGNTKGIHNNQFSGIFADHDGAIWAMTENGVVTIYRNGAFSSYPTPEKWSSSSGIVSDAHGNAMIETLDGYYYFRDGKFIPASDQKEKNVRQVYFKKSGAKWVFRPDGVSRQKNGQIINYPLSLPLESLNTFGSLLPYEDNQGALWFAIKDKIYRLANGNVTVFTKNEIPALKEFVLRVTFEDAEGSVWFVFEATTDTRKSDGQLVRLKGGQFTSFNPGKFVGATLGITDREDNFRLATLR